jgi:hypothetical protein
MEPIEDIPQNYSPLCGWDEYPIHQLVAPMRRVNTSDPRAFERYWFTAQALDGSLFLITGMGFYPNLGVADAFALLVHDRRQITVHAHRSLGSNRADLRVGPIRFGPSRPFAEWNLSLDDVCRDFSFNLRWLDSKRPRFSRPDFGRLRGVPDNIHLLHDWGGYETFGAIEGDIRIGDTSINLAGGQFIGSRDHHWGIRDGVGGINLNPPNQRFSHCAQFVEFKEWAIWGGQILYNIGADVRGPRFTESIDHKFSFDPATRHFKQGIITNRLENGETRRVHYHAIENMTAFLRCAGYAGPDGRGTPHENYLHGQGTGAPLSAHLYDLSDTALRMDIAGFEDNLCTVTCDGETAIGIFECMNPALYEMCATGVPGFSFLHESEQA